MISGVDVDGNGTNDYEEHRSEASSLWLPTRCPSENDEGVNEDAHLLEDGEGSEVGSNGFGAHHEARHDDGG